MAGWRQKPACDVQPGPSQNPPNVPETGVHEYVVGNCALRSESFVCQSRFGLPPWFVQFSGGDTVPGAQGYVPYVGMGHTASKGEARQRETATTKETTSCFRDIDIPLGDPIRLLPEAFKGGLREAYNILRRRSAVTHFSLGAVEHAIEVAPRAGGASLYVVVTTV